jgi:type II secretory pathway pseudopilin PulG
MPLWLLATIVVVGLAAVALLTHLLGWSRARAFVDEAEAMRAWDREFSADPARRADLLPGGHAAVVYCARGTGLVWTMGLDSTARPLAGARLQQTRRGLTIRFPDMAAPSVTLPLDPSERDDWHRRLQETLT